MSDGYEVSGDRLRSAAAGMVSGAEAVEQRMSTLIDTLEGYGQPWGQDDLGTLIGLAHEAVLDAAIQSVADNAEDIVDMAEGVAVMAAAYDEAEQASVQEISSAGDGL